MPQPQFIVLLHDDDLSGSLDPDKANATDLDVVGPFGSVDEAFAWAHDNNEDGRWLCQVHRITNPDKKDSK